MIEMAAVFLTGLVSTAVSGVVGNRSDAICSNLYKKTKELLTKDENKYLNHDIEKSVTAGYYFALYFCAGEYKDKVKQSGDKRLLSEIKDIENIIDEKQKSENTAIWNLFPGTSDLALLIGDTPEKDMVHDIVEKLLASTFGSAALPSGFLKETDRHLFQKMKSYFVEEVKTNERVKNFLDTRMLAEIKESIENYLPMINLKLDEILKPKSTGPDRAYDLKLQLIKKFDSLFGVSPLKEALTVDIKDLPPDIVSLYKSRKEKHSVKSAVEEQDDTELMPMALSMLAFEEETEDFIVADEAGTARMFFIARKCETPFYLYLYQVDEKSSELKDGKVYRTYSVPNSFRPGQDFLIVSVILNEDHAVLQTLQSHSGMFIDRFPVSQVLNYCLGENSNAEFEADNSEHEVYYGMDNPSRVFTFIDAEEKHLIKPKIKYDYQLGTQYGTLTANSSTHYLVLSLSFSIVDEEVDAFDFYKEIEEEAKGLPSESNLTVQFALMIKNRLTSLWDMFSNDSCSSNKPEVLKYCAELFRWTALSAAPAALEYEMDKFIAFLNENMKKVKDKYTILGLSDLQACALYNKGLENRKAGNTEKAAALYGQAIKIIKTILKIQHDYPVRRGLDFYQGALNKITIEQ